jgi:hypothetical protein
MVLQMLQEAVWQPVEQGLMDECKSRHGQVPQAKGLVSSTLAERSG